MITEEKKPTTQFYFNWSLIFTRGIVITTFLALSTYVSINKIITGGKDYIMVCIIISYLIAWIIYFKKFIKAALTNKPELIITTSDIMLEIPKVQLKWNEVDFIYLDSRLFNSYIVFATKSPLSLKPRFKGRIAKVLKLLKLLGDGRNYIDVNVTFIKGNNKEILETLNDYSIIAEDNEQSSTKPTYC